MSISAGGDFKFNIGGDSEEKRKGTTKQEYLDNVEQEVTRGCKADLDGELGARSDRGCIADHNGHRDPQCDRGCDP